MNPEALEIFKQFGQAPTELMSDEDLQLRLITRFINEAVYTLQVRIIEPTFEKKKSSHDVY